MKLRAHTPHDTADPLSRVSTLDDLRQATCNDECPVSRTARLIDGRWTTLIIRDLLGGTRRYSELQASLAGISPKVLAARLRFLEQQGLIHKKVYPVVPPRTEYSLTPLGTSLSGVIQAMSVFGAALPQRRPSAAPPEPQGLRTTCCGEG
jgi:DNA-binding HxlR family transcriptional regulator